jgi:hypothetical protein
VTEKQKECEWYKGGFRVDESEWEEKSCSKCSTEDYEKFSSPFYEVISKCSKDEFYYPWKIGNTDYESGSSY